MRKQLESCVDELYNNGTKAEYIELAIEALYQLREKFKVDTSKMIQSLYEEKA